MAYPALSAKNPTDRASFKEYCLRRLGKPVIEINVDDDQVEDRIDDALQYWFEYHYDGSETQYYKYQITDQDRINGYITLPDNIIGAVEIFDISDQYGVQNMFNIRYQIALNDLYTLTSVSLVPYYMAMQHLSLLAEVLVGKQPIRYNKYNNQLHIDTDWSNFTGSWVMVKAYSVIDPDQWTAAWSDRFLKEYGTQLIKRQWGEHLKKFGGMRMPDGTILNGKEIWDEANQEITRLEHEMSRMTMPAMDMIG